MTAQPCTDPPAISPSIILTPSDVQRLLDDDSAESRANVLEKISHHYNARQFHGRELEIAEQVFRLLMKDVALRVRETLAERIKDNETIPRDIVLHLANDVESVSLPVLAVSKVLSDADLVSIVEATHDMGKLVAISKRETVSPRVSDALVETNYPQVVTSLLGNDGADISARAFEKIIEDFRADSNVTQALVHYHKLPMTIVERLIAQASDAVAAELKEKYKITDVQIKKDAVGARDDFMLQLLAHEMSQGEVEQLVNQMAKEERLSHSLVMTALCRGQLLFFTVAMAKFAGIAVKNAVKLTADRGEHGFAGIYQRSGLPDTMFDAIRLLLRAVQDLEGDTAIPGSMHYANRLVERLLASAGDQQIEYLPYFIALIRQNPRH